MLCIMCPVGKAAPALSEHVGGITVSDVVAGDTVMSGAVSVGLCDLAMLSGGGDTDVSGVDTLVAATVSGGLCDIDRVTGVGDTGVSGVETLVSATVSGSLCDIDRVSGDVDIVLSGAVSSGLCDLDRVSRGDLVERVGDISFSRGGDAIIRMLTSLCVVPIRCWQLVSSTRVVLRWVMTVLRVTMAHGCLTRFVLVAVCRLLDQEWLHLVGWTGSSAQMDPCGPSHHRCPQCVRIIGLSDLCVCVTLSITVGSLVCLVWG